MGYEERIIEALRKSSDGLSIVDIADKAGISKTAAIKYLATFRMAGKADLREVGPSRLWRLVTPKQKEEEKTFVSRTKDLDALVRQFAGDLGLIGLAILDLQGLALSAVLPEGMDTERLGSLVAILSKTGMRTTELARLDKFTWLVVEGSNGKILVYNHGKVLLVVFCKPDDLLGAIRLEMEGFADRVNEFLE